MNRTAWQISCGALLLGCLLGWFARQHTASDRFITALARKHEAVELYYNTKLDQAIQENERILKRGK